MYGPSPGRRHRQKPRARGIPEAPLQKESTAHKNSGIFDTQYDKVKPLDLEKRGPHKIVDYLDPKAGAYYGGIRARTDRDPECPKDNISDRHGSVIAELKKRDITRRPSRSPARAL